MSDLERALRDTFANPPVDIPAQRYPEDSIRWRLERRRSRQKRTAAGLGVAAAIAAAIAVPATTMDFGGQGSSSGSNPAVKGAGLGAAPARQSVPAAVRTAAQELARKYGITRVEWIRTTTTAWADRLPARAENQAAKQVLYVLQVRNYHCVKDCPPQPRRGPVALVATVDQQGRDPATTVRPAYDLSTLGAVHTLTAR